MSAAARAATARPAAAGARRPAPRPGRARRAELAEVPPPAPSAARHRRRSPSSSSALLAVGLLGAAGPQHRRSRRTPSACGTLQPRSGHLADAGAGGCSRRSRSRVARGGSQHARRGARAWSPRSNPVFLAARRRRGASGTPVPRRSRPRGRSTSPACPPTGGAAGTASPSRARPAPPRPAGDAARRRPRPAERRGRRRHDSGRRRRDDDRRPAPGDAAPRDRPPTAGAPGRGPPPPVRHGGRPAAADRRRSVPADHGAPRSAAWSIRAARGADGRRRARVRAAGAPGGRRLRPRRDKARMRTVVLPAVRGQITDINGVALATTRRRHERHGRPDPGQGPGDRGASLAPVLAVDASVCRSR